MTRNGDMNGEVEFRRYTTARIDSLVAGIAKIEATVASLPTRNEIGADIENLVRSSLPTEVFRSEHQSLTDRVAKLEASPQRIISWITVGVGCLSLLSGAGFSLAGVIFLVLFRK